MVLKAKNKEENGLDWLPVPVDGSMAVLEIKKSSDKQFWMNMEKIKMKLMNIFFMIFVMKN